MQIVIFMVTYGFIYKQVVQKFDTATIIPVIFEKLADPNLQLLLAFVLLLMIPNIGIEAQKWRFLIGRFENVSFSRALRAVFTGITVSVFTPNRVGEYFGRVFILNHLNPLRAVLITVMGSMAQLLTTILTGSVCLIIVLPQILRHSEIPGGLVSLGIMISIIIMMIIVTLLYLNFPGVPDFIRKLFPHRREKLDHYISVYEHYNISALLYTIFLSFLRYLVFTAQFIILLYAFGVKMPWLHYLTAIPLIFLAITIIPTVALTELGIRGSVSIYILGFYLENSPGATGTPSIEILAASTLLWLINLAIPAITGTFFVFNLRFIRSKLNNNTQ